MTGFCVRNILGVVVAALIAAFGLSVSPVALQAQTAGKPLSLIPSNTNKSPSVNGASQKAPKVSRGARRLDDKTGQRRKSARLSGSTKRIETAPLAAPDYGSIGLLSEKDGGFDIGMWSDTPRRRVSAAIADLPTASRSSVVQDLTRRLLLTTATMPTTTATAGDQPTNLLYARVERLASAGGTADALQLLSLAPAQTAQFDDATAVADLHWLQNDASAACTTAVQANKQNPSPHWRKTIAFCQYVAGDLDGAELALSLLSEDGVEDALFVALMEKLLGEANPKFPLPKTVQPLHYAMHKMTDMPMSNGWINLASPGVLRAIATDTEADLSIRLAAAERAVDLGILPPKELAGLYQQVSFSDEAKANAIVVAESDPGARTSALLYQVTTAETIPTAQAEALRTAWRLARARDRYLVAAKVNLPITRQLVPNPNLFWAAKDIVHALFAAGDLPRARIWMRAILQQAAAGNQDAVRLKITLWPYLRLLGDDDGLAESADLAEQWHSIHRNLPAEHLQDRMQTMFVLLGALRRSADDRIFDSLLTAGDHQPRGSAVSPAKIAAMRHAAAKQRVGETVAAAVRIINGTPLAKADIHAVGLVIESLSDIGLTEEAKLLAVETALARRL